MFKKKEKDIKVNLKYLFKKDIVFLSRARTDDSTHYDLKNLRFCLFGIFNKEGNKIKTIPNGKIYDYENGKININGEYYLPIQIDIKNTALHVKAAHKVDADLINGYEISGGYALTPFTCRPLSLEPYVNCDKEDILSVSQLKMLIKELNILIEDCYENKLEVEEEDEKNSSKIEKIKKQTQQEKDF